MAISVVQRAVQATTTTTGTISVAFGSNNTLHNKLIVVVIDNNNSGNINKPTDTLGNTYVQIASAIDFTDFNTMRAFVVDDCLAGANTVTATNTTSARLAVYVYEVSGFPSTNSFDKFAFTRAGGSNTPTSGAKTVTNNNELILGLIANGSTTAVTFAAGSGFSNVQQTTDFSSFNTAMEEQIISGGGSQAATWTLASNNGSSFTAMLTFSDTSVTPPSPRIRLLGDTLTTSSGTKTVTATPALNELIVIVTAHSGNTSAATPTDNNSSGTYTTITSALKAASVDLMAVHIRTALIGSATSTVFTHAPGVSTGGGLAVYAVVGMSATGAAAAVQSAVQANHAAVAVPTPTFGAAAQTGNVILSAVFNAANDANLLERSSPLYSLDVNDGYGTPTSGLGAMTINGGETGTAIAWGTSSASAFASLVVEIGTTGGTVFTQALTGGLSFTGSFSRQTTKVLTASLGFVGAIIRFVSHKMTAGLSFAGALKRLITRIAMTAGLSFTGRLIKNTTKSFTGGLSFTGAMTTSKVFLKAFTASLSFTGTFSRAIAHKMTAGLSFTGSLIKRLTRSLPAASLSFIGNLAKRTLKSVFTASLSFTGALAKGGIFFRSFTASLSFTGVFKKFTTHKMTAGLSFVGAIKKSRNIFFTASLSFAGSLAKNTKKTFTAGVSFLGFLTKFIPPHFIPLGVIISSFTNKTTDNSGTNLADVASSGTISAVNSPTNQSDVNTGATDSTVSSDSNERTLS